jgi:inner membrane protein
MIGVSMPSPIGHALTGVAIAWTDRLPETPSDRRLLVICLVLAAAPDLDLLVPGAHRTATHSLAAMVLVTIVAAAVTGEVTRWRTALLCGLSYGSHLLLDWLAADNYPPRGIQLWWPFSHRWFISDLDLFRQTARQQFLTPPIIRQNLVAVAQEVVILLPVLAVIWWARARRRAIKK